MFKLLARFLGVSPCPNPSRRESGADVDPAFANSTPLHSDIACMAATAAAHPIQAPGVSTAAAVVSQIRLPNDMDAYLLQKGNASEDIARFHRVLSMGHVILELGCGGGEVAWQIASRNPQAGVIATDKFDLTGPSDEGSFYRKVARAWESGQLLIQQTILDNLVVLRAEADLLQYLPKRSIDTVLLINPEPAVGEAFVGSVQRQKWLDAVKPGDRRIVIKPFSREMNVMSCGGYEFDHSEDWSRGLGFILGSALHFKKAHPVQWSVDLSNASPYCKNSTQNSVYVCGEPAADTPAEVAVTRPTSKRISARRLNEFPIRRPCGLSR
jgi:hypothetical protein